MSLESYVTGLMKNPHPSGKDRLALSILESLEGIYLSQVTKKQKNASSHALDAGIPVISVGNITAGGTGKTPCIIRLAELLTAAGRHPAVISRGYRSGLEKQGGIVSDGKEILVSQKMAGDEPYMMALKLPKVPVLVGKDRIISVERAKRLGADLLLLDDGFQYWKLKRERDIILLDATNPFGYEHALPRGLLREPLSALKRASLFIITKSDQAEPSKIEEIKNRLTKLAPGIPVTTSCHSPAKAVHYDDWKGRIHEGPLSEMKGKRAYLMSGIGNPAAFGETAKEAGFIPVGEMAFDDHHAYTEEDIRKCDSEAALSGADCVLITEKDAVKMMKLSSIHESAIPFYVLEIEMTFPEGLELLKKQWEDL